MKQNYFLSIILFFAFALCRAEIPQNEKNALLAIAESLNITNWNDQTPINKWPGVTISNINGADHVTALKPFIPFSNIVINFSEKISELVYLEDLSIEANSSIIKLNFDFKNLINLSLLKNLTVVSRYNKDINVQNSFLNLDSISQLSNLESLKLGLNNNLFTIPSSFLNLPKLKSLYYKNDLKRDIPKEIYNLTNLEELSIDTANLNPDEYEFAAIKNLINLKYIFLRSNNLAYLPNIFYELKSLESLRIQSSSNNFFVSSAIANYANQLKTLSVEADEIFNQSQIWTLKKLEELHLSSFDLEILPAISEVKNLKKLSITPKSSTLKIPKEISELVNLEELYIHNTFVYTYDELNLENIFNIPNLKILVIPINESNMSENIGKLQKLEHLQIFAGPKFTIFPEAIGSIKTLKYLDFLSDNAQEAVSFIPNSYKDWPLLEQFWSQRKMVGDITNRFISSPNLKTIAIDPFLEEQVSALKGTLNLCNNKDVSIIVVNKTEIDTVDLRNNEHIKNSTLGYANFIDTKVSKFIVDDVEQFNALVASGKITIQSTAPNGYEVVTSTESCEKPLGNYDLAFNKTIIYPNPTNNIINFKTNHKIEDAQITSISGQIFNINISKNQADLSTLSSGIYILKWKENGVLNTEKIIKK